MLIEIARAVKVTLLGSEIQTLRIGEIYDVAPAIGRVLVSEGWATEMFRERRDLWTGIAAASDDDAGDASGS